MFFNLLEDVNQTGQLTHINHIEDNVFGGRDSTEKAIQTLLAVHHSLKNGKMVPNLSISTKYDGAPAIIFGKDPEQNRFFVATKSMFNRTPKINYSTGDIAVNHPQPDLQRKLGLALAHLPTVTPPGIFQGDIMHTPEDLIQAPNKIAFRPNTITYSLAANHPQVPSIIGAKVGLVVHSQYYGTNMRSLQIGPISKPFGRSPTVNLISAEVVPGRHEYHPLVQENFMANITQAGRQHFTTDHNYEQAIQAHQPNLESYIHHTVRTGTQPSINNYKQYLEQRAAAAASTVKMDATKKAKIAIGQQHVDFVNQNEHHFQRAFQIHKHLTDAKNSLLTTLNKYPEFDHSINGVSASPEGFVVTHNGQTTKLINRAGFSAANFQNVRFKNG